METQYKLTAKGELYILLITAYAHATNQTPEETDGPIIVEMVEELYPQLKELFKE